MKSRKELLSEFRPTARDPVVHGDVCYILLQTGDVAICDAADYDLVRRFKWSLGGHPERREVRRGKSFGELQPVLLRSLLLKRVPFVRTCHLNGDRLDLRRANLVYATAGNINSRRVMPNKHGYRGVSWAQGRYRAYIGNKTNGTHRYLGLFGTPEDAARAYDAAAREQYGPWAHLNFVEERMS